MTWLLFGSWILQKRLWFSHSFQYEHRPFFKVTKSQVKSKFFLIPMGFYNKDPVFGTSGVSQFPKKNTSSRPHFFFSRRKWCRNWMPQRFRRHQPRWDSLRGVVCVVLFFFLVWLHLKLPNRKLIRLPISRYHTSIWIKNRTCHFFSTFLPCS